jgi:hypothetical protein
MMRMLSGVNGKSAPLSENAPIVGNCHKQTRLSYS